MTKPTAIAEYHPTEAALADLRARHGVTVWVVDTPERMAGAKEARAEIRKWRIDLEAERKRIKRPALDRCRDIDGEAKRITAELLLLEGPVDRAIKEVEQAAKREAERIEREEAARVEKVISEGVRIRNITVDLVGASAAAIKAAAEKLMALDLSWTAEFEGELVSARDDVVGKLRGMHKEALKREEERVRLEAERAELEKLRAEQAERERADRERREAEERERRDKMEAEERESRARIAEEERLAREARAKADAEARAVREAEESRLRAEREKVEARRRAEEEAKREAQRERDTRMDAVAMLGTFRDRYGHIDEFSVVVGAIAVYFAEHGK